MRLIRRLFITIALLAPAFSVPVMAQTINDQVCIDNPQSTFCQDSEDQKDESPESNSLYGPNGIITKIVRLLSLVIGIAAVIVIIIGGIRYVTSSGDPNNTTGAKNTILFAIVGLLVALLAQAIIIFVISKI